MRTENLTKGETKVRIVTKSRLIAALLAELDAAQATIFGESSVDRSMSVGAIKCEFRVPFTDSQIEFVTKGDESQTLKCTCCYSGQRISFELTRVEGSRWKLPDRIEFNELRRNERLAFANRMYSAELVTSRAAIYGYAIDINADYLAIDVDTKPNINEGESVKVIIRPIGGNIDVFYYGCILVQIKAAAPNSSRLIFKRESLAASSKTQRRHQRKVADSASLQISESPFADALGEVLLPIRNVSNGGMTVALARGRVLAQVTPGLIVKSKQPKLSFIVVWMDTANMGLRPIVSEPSQLAEWYKFLDQIAPAENQKTSVTRKELAELLIHSGLLKGKRRKPLGIEAKDHVLGSDAEESLLLIQRLIFTDKEGHADAHVSSKRISDTSWLLGDGAALTDNFGSYIAMLDSCTQSLAALVKQSHLFCRFVAFIWVDIVKSSAKWCEEIGALEGSVVMDALQSSIMSFKNVNNAQSDAAEINDISHLNANQRRELSLKFNAMLYETFVGNDGTHPIMNSELGKYGPYHRTRSVVVELGGGGGTLVVHRIFTHNIWSSTGVTNSAFVLVPRNASPESLKSGLAAIADHEISFGTDDFLVIIDGPRGTGDSYTSCFSDAKPFSFVIHDLSLNEKLVFKDS